MVVLVVEGRNLAIAMDELILATLKCVIDELLCSIFCCFCICSVMEWRGERMDIYNADLLV